MTEERVIWLPDEHAYGRLLSLGAYASLVEYDQSGVTYTVYISNDDFEYLGEPNDDED